MINPNPRHLYDREAAMAARTSENTVLALCGEELDFGAGYALQGNSHKGMTALVPADKLLSWGYCEACVNLCVLLRLGDMEL